MTSTPLVDLQERTLKRLNKSLAKHGLQVLAYGHPLRERVRDAISFSAIMTLDLSSVPKKDSQRLKRLLKTQSTSFTRLKE